MPSRIGFKSFQDTLVFLVDSYIETLLDVGQNMEISITVKSVKRCGSNLQADTLIQVLNALTTSCSYQFDAREYLANWNLGKLLKSEATGCEVLMEIQVFECNIRRYTNLSEAVADFKTIWVDTINSGELRFNN
jgi:hypothetical protein